MLRAGFGDTVGKFSALNDWKLGSLLTGEPFCQGVADLVMEAVNEVVGWPMDWPHAGRKAWRP